MDIGVLKALCSQIHGATFATLDAETRVPGGLIKETTGKRVILFRTSGASGYENRVKKLLEEAGSDPDGFHVGPLPWGTRVDNLPIIENKGKFYLQCIELTRGEEKYRLPGTLEYIGNDLVSAFGVRPRRDNPDLPRDKQVRVSCYEVSNVLRLSMLGQRIEESHIATKTRRSILRINYDKE